MSKKFKEEIEKDEITFINSLHHEVELFLNSTGNKEKFHEEKALLNDRTIEILKVLGYDLGTNKESKENMKLIAKIADRGWKLVEDCYKDKLSLIMDIEFTHKVNPLRLYDWLISDDSNFNHDLIGILNHFDRRTKKLGGCFCPRFSNVKENLKKVTGK